MRFGASETAALLSAALASQSVRVVSCSDDGHVFLITWTVQVEPRYEALVVCLDGDWLPDAGIGHLPAGLGLWGAGTSRIAPDGSLLVAWSGSWRRGSDEVVAWRTSDGAAIWRIPVENGMTGIAFSRRGSYVALDRRDSEVARPPHARSISVNRTADGGELWRASVQPDPSYGGVPGTALGWEGDCLLYASAGALFRAEATRGSPQRLVDWPTGEPIGELATSPDGANWACAPPAEAAIGDETPRFVVLQLGPRGQGDGAAGPTLRVGYAGRGSGPFEWSPDSRCLYYRRAPSAEGATDLGTIEIASLRESAVQGDVLQGVAYTGGLLALRRVSGGACQLGRVASGSGGFVPIASGQAPAAGSDRALRGRTGGLVGAELR